GKTNLSHDGLNPAHVPYWWVNNPTLGEFCFTMIGRADIKGSKSNVAMNAWLPQASYPCGNFSDTSSFKFRRSKGSIGHAFTVRIRTENQNQTSFYPFVLHEIFVLVELILGHLHYLLTDVPPQPNSPPDNVLRPDRPAEASLGSKRRGCYPASDSRIGLESSLTGSSFPADSAKPVPLAVVSLDSRQGHLIPLVRTSSELAVQRPGKAPGRAIPSPSPGRHGAVHSRHVSSSSSPPTVDGFGTGTPEPSPQNQSFSRSYGSILPTSLAYIVPSTRGCSPWRPDAVMRTCDWKEGGSNLSDKGLNLSGSWQQGHSATYNTPSRLYPPLGGNYNSRRSERRFHRTDLANDTCLWEPKLLLRVGNRAAGACVASSPDSDLEAFSHNPAHGSFAPLASQPSAMTNCANQRFLSY
ncbi:unnamed protein product, partial [Brassica rapa subsp. trilocularis]